MTAKLNLAGIYRREVEASLDRIWENVFDWQHLDHLHESSFAQCRLIAKGKWGWRARLTLAGGATESAQIIELRADRPGGRYTTTTLEGPGTGTEIRAILTPRAPHETGVVVEFHVPETRSDRLAAIGSAYVVAYTRLWDEDEAMMRTREQALARRGGVRSDLPVEMNFGTEVNVRARLPLLFELAGEPFRLVDVGGVLVAHATTCPHWLGPLGEAPVIDGRVRCPWHGYVFDIRSGKCTTGAGARLATAPVVRVLNGYVRATARDDDEEWLPGPDSNRRPFD